MKSFYLVLYIVAAVLFLVAVFVPNPAVTNAGGRVRGFHLVAAGLFVWVLVDVCRQWDLVVD